MLTSPEQRHAVRIALIAVIAALAFAAGLAVRFSTGESGAAEPTLAKPLTGSGAPPPVGLVPADPGALRRPVARRRQSSGPPDVAAPIVSAPAPAAPQRPAPVVPFDSSG
jgi:hypothetical protein